MASTSANMSQEEALRLFENGGFFFIPNLPAGFEFGIDYNSWKTGPKFKGVKMIPPGCHFIFVSCSGGQGGQAPRIGFFHYFQPKQLLLMRTFTDLVDETDQEKVERIRLDLKNLDQYLGAYPFENSKTWFSLTYLIDGALIERLEPEIKRISAQCDLVSKEFEELGASGQRVDRQNPVRVRYSDSQGLPIMHLKPGSEIRFTAIPSADLGHCTVSERTARSMDLGFALRGMLATYERPKQLLGELQFAYICFLVGHVFEAFEQWKLLIRIFCNCEDALGELSDLFAEFIRVLHFQLKMTPQEFFVDIVSSNNFLAMALFNFFLLIDSSDSASVQLKRKSAKFKNALSAKYGWDFDSVPDEYQPVIVE
ncbi:AAR2 protein [Trichuris trichiura]|uniref:Protein AAR2 homolog n=1 Tax=Trichuris trichiura TaxID=36087 RepID=A0A077Z6S9_TRITR|nr:AAR2 protein [Trichuris trichiura]